MRTRSKPSAKSKPSAGTLKQSPEVPSLPPIDTNPPKVVILPRNASPEARIVTLQSPATSSPNRYFYCPKLGLYEFTKIAPSRKTPRSWLLPQDNGRNGEASNNSQHESSETMVDGDSDGSIRQGYIMKEPDMLLATPFDPIFLLLPILSAPNTSTHFKQKFLEFDEYLDEFAATSAHAKHLIGSTEIGKLLETRIASVCEVVEAGEEKMYRISHEILVQELLSKARRMCENGLPASMEEQFVKSALKAPVFHIPDAQPEDQIRKGGSFELQSESLSIQSETTTDSQASIASVSGSSTNPDSQSTTVTQATSISATPQPPESDGPAEEVRQLLRLRVALNFILSSCLPPHLKQMVETILSENKVIDFSSLDKQLEHLETLRRQAQALRSLSDNISRKRAADDDDEAAEARAEKKRKKEEEEKKKKSESRAQKELKKVDTKGMKKLSAFFTKAAK
ncbi:hypothetical protein NA57DRAFT_77216 [Rhizodiscina lignyota]|uniref:Ribonuclease H2 subunit B n=1 Tax=Rhizodiscina lignyota TaxID=1504668 RepID=A0A9P4I854_9PEZI|nr:hypothetical protein NA57DRAFT_77216 [Rhizodiscina lignyota]